MMGWGWEQMMGGWAWPMAILGLLSTVLFWAVLILGLVWLVRSVQRPGEAPGAPGPREPSGALGILEERLARGEIGIEEFQSRRAAILAAPR